MNDAEYEKLKKDINYMNEEGMVPEGKQLLVFRDPEDAINAMRRNEIPGMIWTEENEIKFQKDNLEKLI